jgi:hypothetical protein
VGESSGIVTLHGRSALLFAQDDKIRVLKWGDIPQNGKDCDSSQNVPLEAMDDALAIADSLTLGWVNSLIN